MKNATKVVHAFFVFLLITGIASGCAGGDRSSKGTVIVVVAESSPFAENEANPHSLYAGAKLAADQINELGGVNGYTVEVVAYEDQNDAELAKQNAQTITQSDAIAVIGHSSSETIRAAAPLYEEAGITAISAAPVTKETFNDLTNYFNVTYTSEQQGAYLANYTFREQQQNNAMIVHTDEASSVALAKKFENTFRGLGGTVLLSIVLNENATDGEIQAAVGKIFSVNEGALLIAGNDHVSAEFIIALKNRGFQNPTLGGENLSTYGFIERINAVGAEQARPGYFTDDIITTRAILPDSAGDFTSQFIKDYQKEYPNISVSNMAAHGYDAMLAILGALQATPETTPSSELRLEIQQALLRLSNPETAIEGVTGPIYFNHSHTALRGTLFGVYQNGYLISAPVQYKPILLPETISNLAEQEDLGHIITVDGERVYKTNIVYAGVDIIEIRGIDQKESTYTADFYLWFRYIPNDEDKNFQPENIVFTNAEEIISTDEINSETTSDGSVYTTLRVSGKFKNQFNFAAYPFDQHDLTIQFRNQNATATFIQYVTDRPGMRYANDEKLLGHWVENDSFVSLYGWKPFSAHVDQNLFKTTSTLGNPKNFDDTVATSFSLFDVHLLVERNSLEFIIKSLLPLFLTLILAYITFYLPLGHSERIGVGSTALLTTAFFHFNLASALPEIGYTIVIEYFFYAAYLMSALIVLLETLSIRLEKQSEETEDKDLQQKHAATRQKLNLTGRIVYPSILALVLLVGWFAYMGWIDFNVDNDTVRRAVSSVQDIKSNASDLNDIAVQPESDSVTTLELASWRPEDDAQITSLLEAFHKDNPEINVVHLPIFGPSYRSILNVRLGSNNAGPDMFFVPPFQRAYSEHTIDLASLPIEENYAEDLRAPWQDENGKYYGLPYVGVVQGVYYNKDIFDKLQLSTPTSWEEFLQTAEILKTAGYIPIGNSLVANEENDMFMNLAANFIDGPQGRAQYMNPANGGRCFNDSSSVKAFNAIAELIPYLSRDFNSISSYTSKQRFIDQKAAMLFGGSWDVNYFSSSTEFNWDVFAVPAAQNSQTYVIFQPDIAIGINNTISPAKQEAALKFFKWLMTAESLNLSQEILPGFYPLSNIELNKVDNLHSHQFKELTDQFPTDLRWAYSEISVTNQVPSPATLMRDAQYAMIKDKISPQEAADQLQAGMAEWYEPAQTCGK